LVMFLMLFMYNPVKSDNDVFNFLDRYIFFINSTAE
jgi:hypothetical protein